ncbi:MAG: dipeptide epimerase [Maricaulaceae bacterium]
MNFSIKTESWPIRGHFTISRSSLTSVDVVIVEISKGNIVGHGECRPYSRYNETPQTVCTQLEALRHDIKVGRTHDELIAKLPAGAARNALDCALWDYACKSSGLTIWDLTKIPSPTPQATAFTISVDSPQNMAKLAKQMALFKILKIKVDAERFTEQITAVATARPDCQLIVDANEALSASDVLSLAKHSYRDHIALIEQPLHDDIIRNHKFENYNGPILCADESFHGVDDLLALKRLGYGALNIKLDKCGGLTSALKIIEAAKAADFYLMGGCMLSTSLAVAPMAAIMGLFDIIDLDAGALLAQDREHGLVYENGRVYPPKSALWG